jgi:ATP-dependent Clp protease ATP-binding subunit ClpA
MRPLLKEIKLQLSVQLAMNIANREACLSNSSYIEPFHILLAILNIVDDKYSETAELMGLKPDQLAVIERVIVECRSLLNISDKEITTIRRTLHNILRKREPHPVQLLELSRESTYLIQKAARRAYREGLEEVDLAFVLQEVLADLPKEVVPFFKIPDDRKT